MPAQHVIAVDLARVYRTAARRGFIRTMAWGDYVEVQDITASHVRLKLVEFVELPDGSIEPKEIDGFIAPTKGSGIDPQTDLVTPRDQSDVLKVNFVDVQQGDGSVIETPSGKVILVDGGDNQLFARYLANRYRGTSLEQPREIECIVVSHGDADHFQGLTRIFSSETESFDSDEQWKRLFIAPKRVYHNGLVKRPDSVPEADSLGATTSIGAKTIITGLEENLLHVNDAQMNGPFREWKAALATYNGRMIQRGQTPILFRRLAKGDDDAFGFLASENIQVEVLGPILTVQDGVRGLRFLGKPPAGPRIGHPPAHLKPRRFSGKSASHTINGHSVVLRLTYGGFHFLLPGDLNEEAERDLTAEHREGQRRLTAEVFKVPHHGSDDFSVDFLEAVAPVVSVVSAGDENARKEYIHPRATLMAALGKYSRFDEPLVFVTELVAFFNVEGFVTPEFHRLLNDRAVIENGQAVVNARAKKRFFAFRRTVFGLVKIRTDGRRLLVYTDSGNIQLKEAYAYSLNAAGDPEPASVRQV